MRSLPPSKSRWTVGTSSKNTTSEGLQVSRFSRSPHVRKPRRRARGGARAPPRHLPCLEKSRDHHLDAQNQWPDGERFHPGRKDRQALQTLNSAPSDEISQPSGNCPLLLLSFLLYTFCPLYYRRLSSGFVRRYPSSAASEFAAWRCVMWRKPQENKQQSALDALPSTVPSPQGPAAASPQASPNAPACVTQASRSKEKSLAGKISSWMARSKEKFTLPIAVSLSVPTPASTQKSKPAKLSFAGK